jgi:hypothetical protein
MAQGSEAVAATSYEYLKLIEYFGAERFVPLSSS